MNWTVDWRYELHPLDRDRPIRIRSYQHSRIVVTEVEQTDRYGEIIKFIWFRNDYLNGAMDDPDRRFTVIDEQQWFYERQPGVHDTDVVKLRFDTSDNIDRIRVYRGRRKTHELERDYLTYSRLYSVGREAWIGCLRDISKYDCRGMNPTIRFKWPVFKHLLLGDFYDCYHAGEFGPLKQEAVS